MIFKALGQVGFSESVIKRELLIIDSGQAVAPGFLPRPIKRAGMIRFGGGVGIYFEEFEILWKNELSAYERNLGFTLPLGMLIDNYLRLIDNGVFELLHEYDEMVDRATHIYNICLELPRSIDELVDAFSADSLLGINISNYLHIAEYNTDDNVFFRKSVRFIGWFVEKWPQHADKLYRCLSQSQLRRLDRLGQFREFREHDT